ncbi:YbaK/EbsC family protein [Frigoribacterium sp. CFBP 13605]|uniref:aminoacyl-tRNA deacylase n=1 Tax=Frigoribacterium sp. CFBP 13605 TaxID=2774034 RepID=UPI0019042FB8|nr:YbaK/EbsC family protein [Frigoribacterium sp. CFBP 13605]MBD8141242.1 YbaK/EbsC family protein [Frigoribacterium sp. CFBP 13605]
MSDGGLTSGVDDADVGGDQGRPDGADRVRADAAARGLAVEIVARPAADSLEAAAALLGLQPSDIVKSLVVKRHDGSFLFALVPGDRQISWAKLRAVVGVNKLSMPSADVALEVTGYERGTITPLGSSTAWPVVADSRIVGRRVALGAGAHGFSAFVETDDLVAAYDATVADVSD